MQNRNDGASAEVLSYCQEAQAVLSGLKNGLIDTIDAIAHPLDNIFYPISDLAFDTTVIMAQHTDTTTIPDPYAGDIAALQFVMSKNPQLYVDASSRMQERVDNIKAQGIQFVNATGLEKIESLAHLAATIYVPGTLLKAGSAVKAVSNLNKFGFPQNPVLFPNRILDHFTNRPPIKKFTLEEIREMQSYKALRYLVTEEGELIITPSFYPEPVRKKIFIEGLDKDYVREKIFHSEIAELKPVTASGDLCVEGGQIKRIDNCSGHYTPNGKHLPTLIKRAFRRHGYKEVKKTHFQDLGFEVPTGPYPTQTPLDTFSINRGLLGSLVVNQDTINPRREITFESTMQEFGFMSTLGDGVSSFLNQLFPAANASGVNHSNEEKLIAQVPKKPFNKEILKTLAQTSPGLMKLATNAANLQEVLFANNFIQEGNDNKPPVTEGVDPVVIENLLTEYAKELNVQLQRHLQASVDERKAEQIAQKFNISPDFNREHLPTLESVAKLNDAMSMVAQGALLAAKVFNSPSLAKGANAIIAGAQLAQGIAGLIAGGPSFGSVTMILSGLNGIAGCLGDDSNNGLGEALQAIMGQLKAISQQIYYMHKDMLEQFSAVFKHLNIIHEDMLLHFNKVILQNNIQLHHIEEIKELQLQQRLALNTVDQHVLQIENRFAGYFDNASRKQLQSVLNLTDEKIKSHLEHKEFLSQHQAIFAALKQIADEIKAQANDRQHIDERIQKSLTSGLDNAYLYVGNSLAKNSSITFKAYDFMLDPISLSLSINSLLRLQKSLEDNLQISYRVSQTCFDDLTKLLQSGKRWRQELEVWKRNQVLSRAILDYQNQMHELFSYFSHYFQTESYKTWEQMLKLHKPHAQQMAHALRSKFEAMTMTFASYPGEGSLATPTGAYRGNTGGYYHIVFNRSSTGKQVMGQDVFIQEWWHDMPAFNGSYGGKNSATIRNEEFAKWAQVFNQNKMAILSSTPWVSLTRAPVSPPAGVLYFEPDLDLYNGHIKTLGRSFIQFVVADMPNAHDYPILPLPPVLVVTDEALLQLEMLSLGVIEYTYQLVNNTISIAANFHTLNEMGEKLEKFPIYHLNMPFVLPSHFKKQEAIWNLWFGGNCPSGVYQNVYFGATSAGNGHATETIHLLEPVMERYYSITERLKHTNYCLNIERREQTNLLAKAMLNNFFKQERMRLNQNLLAQAQLPSSDNQNQFQMIWNKLDTQAKYINAMMIFMYHDVYVKNPGIIHSSGILTKNEWMQLFHHYHGSPQYFNEILIELNTMQNQYLNFIQVLEKDNTKVLGYNTGLKVSLTNLKNFVQRINENDLIIDNKSFYDLAERKDSLLFEAGREAGKAKVMSMMCADLSKSLYHEAINCIAEASPHIADLNLVVDEPNFLRGYVLGAREGIMDAIAILSTNNMFQAVSYVAIKILPIAHKRLNELHTEMNKLIHEPRTSLTTAALKKSMEKACESTNAVKLTQSRVRFFNPALDPMPAPEAPNLKPASPQAP